MLTALEAVRNRMYANFERGVTTWLYIDEVQSLFGHPAIISYFSKFWAEGRKFNLICTGITQNSTYMLEHEDARNMVLNSDFVLLHKQSHLDRKSWVDLLALSAQEEGYIDDSIKAGEGLLVAGGVRVPLKDDFPKGALYDLFNTKPEEIAQIKRAQAFARAGRAAMPESVAKYSADSERLEATGRTEARALGESERQDAFSAGIVKGAAERAGEALATRDGSAGRGRAVSSKPSPAGAEKAKPKAHLASQAKGNLKRAIADAAVSEADDSEELSGIERASGAVRGARSVIARRAASKKALRPRRRRAL